MPQRMNLTIDVGNTHITLGAFDGDALLFVARLATDRLRTDDQYAIELRDIFKLYQIASQSFSGGIIGSVVPELTTSIQRAVTKVTGIKPLIVGPGIKTGLNIKTHAAGQVGADLVAGAVAAITKYPLPCIVFDMGTATTLSLIDANACLSGCVIAAGVGISLDALATRTSMLPHISLDTPDSVIGLNTVDCMRSGAVFGAAAMLDGLVERIEKEAGPMTSLVATGGLAKEIIQHCNRQIEYNNNLLLEGLHTIYLKNV